MSTARRLLYLPLLLLLPLPVASAQTITPTDTAPPPIATPTPSNRTYPQIVRLSYIQGDVRLLRGKTQDGNWEQAAINVPLEQGFSIATGNGRVEIEFEDASTAYIGENSVLTFNTLTSTNGVPRTDITLVSGTLTVDEQPRVSGERFLIHSPTEVFAVAYPSRVYARFESFTDAMTVTPQRDIRLHISSAASAPSTPLYEMVAKGTSVTLRDSKVIPVPPAETADSAASKTATAWDAWVTQRVSERDAAMKAAMRESGLNTPIPGLAELRAQGKFFPCAPYGTCWEPTNGWASQYVVNVNQLKGQSAAVQQAVSTQQGHTMIGGGAAPALLQDDDIFPCSPFQTQRYLQRDPLTGQTRLFTQQSYLPGSWAVCHAGSWIHTQRGYAWVALQQKHHHCPIAWVKTNGKTGFVPIHPNDIAGKRPINLEHGLFVPTGHKDSEIEHLAVSPDHSVKLRTEPPSRFQSEPTLTLARAETPRLEAHPLASISSTAALAVHGTGIKPIGTPISFNRSSQSIQLAHQVTTGSHTATVVQSFGGQHFGGSNGFSSSSGGFSGAHSGLSSSASSGASHSSGASSSAASASSSFASATASSSASAGSHK